MNKRIILSLFAILSALIVPSLAQEEKDSGIVLRGVLDMGSKQLFSVSTAGGASTAWVKIGDGFGEYEIVSYDPEKQVLTVVRDEQEIKVPMAGVSQAAAHPEGTMDERIAEARRIMHVMNFEETLDRTIEAQMKGMTNVMRQQMQQMSPGEEVDEELLNFQMKAMEEMFADVDWSTIKEGLINVYAEVFTKDELTGIVDFYATPAGQASLDKAPELNMKTMEIMTPMIMDASKNMQEKMVKFYQDRQQKANAATETSE